jgi:pimeloyl-ACP methyl ester carboxylesterase
MTNRILVSLLGLLMAAGCSDAAGGERPSNNGGGGNPGGSGGTTFGTGGSSASPGTGGFAAGSGGAPFTGGVGGLPPGTGGTTPGTGGAQPGSGGTTPGTGGTGGSTPLPPAGPEDGDPNAPIIAAPGVACGANNPVVIPSTNVTIGGRGVFVSYPCNKHAGAPAVFILNLHGTMPAENTKLYQVPYFAAHKYAASHNLIVAAPKAVGQQWGNGDGGADAPHLMEVIDWVYTNLAQFDIRAMWVGGHSWGGMYTATFGCRQDLASKVKGLIMMSGGGVGAVGGAACADRVSVILSMAEFDKRQPSDQSSLAATHGCDAAQQAMILNNQHTFWPNCNPTFAHANYFMLGKQHADFMDADVVKSIVDWIKLARP